MSIDADSIDAAIEERLANDAARAGRVVPWHAFQDRFPHDLQVAIVQAALEHPVVWAWLLRGVSQPVDLDSPVLRAGLDVLIALGVLTSEQRDVLLAGGTLVELP